MNIDIFWAKPLALQLASTFSSFFRCLQMVFCFSSTSSPIRLDDSSPQTDTCVCTVLSSGRCVPTQTASSAAPGTGPVCRVRHRTFASNRGNGGRVGTHAWAQARLCGHRGCAPAERCCGGDEGLAGEAESARGTGLVLLNNAATGIPCDTARQGLCCGCCFPARSLA